MDIENTLVMQGGAIKALGQAQDGGRPVGKLGGVLCRFSSADDPDQTPERDFFDATTDFKLTDGMTTPVYYHHGLHAGVGVKEIGRGVLRVGRDGIGIECGLWLDDAEGVRCYSHARAGRLAWSSGTAAHLVKRTPVATKSGGVSHHIDFWPLGLDASLTPHAAEPRNIAVALKSLMGTAEHGVRYGNLPQPLAGAPGSLVGTRPGDGWLGETAWSWTVDEAELKSLEALEAGQHEGSRLVDHSARLRDAIAEFGERIGAICVNRATKAGPVFSEERHAALCALAAEMRGAAGDLEELLQANAPGRKSPFGTEADAESEELECRVLEQQITLQGFELDALLSGCPWSFDESLLHEFS